MTDDVHELLRLAMREVAVLSVMVATEKSVVRCGTDRERFLVELLAETGAILERWVSAPTEVADQGRKIRAYATLWAGHLAEIPDGLSEEEFQERAQFFEALPALTSDPAAISLRLRALIALREDRFEDAKAILGPPRLRLA